MAKRGNYLFPNMYARRLQPGIGQYTVPQTLDGVIHDASRVIITHRGCYGLVAVSHGLKMLFSHGEHKEEETP